ncbi:MAG TPA: PfaD family polyunsaturated fatty acid/polyketide biosynthesis protein [Oligoflexus sp.]|uniref:PfaD family polyunsaturated fatty acid/polyketide biosynthesis protein n=1 Tax=Oligoflexus sp. TaxID=1971216 RepID=UPI002D4D6E36|nr:PfaD family polyunsaturated fatty acid/polyketide biosynthesis protein [Oligoflexus sp.]HYX34888.1 PfaD family polyunsaturated fatty acid/polyketide biosynthesis protein [Oligoflexus sp.]
MDTDQSFRNQLRHIESDLAWTRPDGRKAFVPGLKLSDFGDPGFCLEHKLRLPYMAGAMAHGIASVDLVVALAEQGMLGAYGAAGLPLERVAAAIDELKERLGSQTFAVNFIHSPQEPVLEQKLAQLLIDKDVRLVEASAFMRLSKALVYYRVKGLRQNEAGAIEARHHIIAKVSRVEVARQFWAPPPPTLLDQLLKEGLITSEERQLASQLPMAVDLTVEADSGGHTDNRPLVTLMPQMLALKEQMETAHAWPMRLRVGAAGGIATPHAVLAAFAMGAAYVVTGTINQACVESGTSAVVREMLAETQQGDIMMAPAADMFEMGVKVQVLKRGTMFAMRAQRLYEIYRQYAGLDQIPDKDRQVLEDSFFRQSLESAWESTEAYFQTRDPHQIARAARDPKHKMSLLFRSYLGQASHWATQGHAERRIDYQIWCGPAMPAFNDWVRGSCLQAPTERRAVSVAWNLLYHAAVLQRVQFAALQGRFLSTQDDLLRPVPDAELQQRLQGAI